MKRFRMRRRQGGQSIVELALILPFLVLITLGVLELGFYVFSYSELEGATRRAAEWAAHTPPSTTTTADDNSGDKCALLIKEEGLKNVVVSDLKNENFTITYPAGSQRERGDEVQVQVTYQGQWLSPIGNRFFGNTLNFSFIARRTIVSTDPPMKYKPDCSE